MQLIQRFKYLFVYTIPVTVWIAFHQEGWITFLPLITYFGFVPLLELLVSPDSSNWDKRKEEDEKNQGLYDWILFGTVPVQLFFLIYFFDVIAQTPFGSLEFYGRVTAMGFMCGVVGINVGHELGHRPERWQQFLGEILLLTSLNTHFLPYHNAGHHRNVATPEDSATARKNEILFIYWFRSHFGSYLEAWSLENARMKAENRSILHWSNRMVIYSLANILVVTGIYFAYGTEVLWGFLGAAALGIILLETVNYIEHYGLLRKKKENGRYEAVRHQHSWNSDHPIGRTLLFNLSRHSDHHYNGSKKYQILKSHPSSPKMPTGYPGMMLLALVPPLWFFVMNKKLAPFRPAPEELLK
ncbi:alkane 1-monooxygenase [Aureicoccus marinus]|jgi:alkane 1-monooxygenase|uniref:Alkane 1-monooxygenase n=1 Tax=Aureicoccus marinus TaxID=754435 RepID=A0A2S7T570_9FLAO|nr:alkane 1-monooxygenase [Aureicoccus marinus]PQJ14748.1 alkane 1-monooxygenase [Aureicoccus marinus]